VGHRDRSADGKADQKAGLQHVVCASCPSGQGKHGVL